MNISILFSAQAINLIAIVSVAQRTVCRFTINQEL